MPDPTPTDRAEYARYIATATQTILSGLSDVPHNAVLDTLLSAYASKLVRHPCCIPSAIEGLRSLVASLEVLTSLSAAAKPAADGGQPADHAKFH